MSRAARKQRLANPVAPVECPLSLFKEELMSKISISLAMPSNNLDAVKLIHKVTGLPLGVAKEKISMGEKGVFYSTELFLNDHVTRDKEIRALIHGFHEIGLDLYIAEIPYDQDWDAAVDIGRIDEEILENMLDSAYD